MSNKHQNKRWFSIYHPEKFHLMWYYSITSFIVICIVSFLVGEIFSRTEKNNLIERSEKYAGYIVKHINRAMYEDFFVPAIRKYGYIDLENNQDQFNRLDKVIKSNIYGFNLKKVYLFDMNGQVIYSNISEHIGYVLERGNNQQLDSAIKGVSASALQAPGTKDSKDVRVEESLLESYYPIYEYREGVVNRENQVGVLELYQYMADLDVQLAMAHRKAVIITCSSMGLLFLMLLMIIKKASSVIRLKTDQLVEARVNLEGKVEERTQEIKQTYERLHETQKRLNRSEKLAGMGTLAAGVAHEINNPLASVASCAEGLMNRMDNVAFKSRDDKEVFPDYLKTICDETYRCKSIISKLLDFSRRHEPVLRKVDVNSVVPDVVKLAGQQIDPKKYNIVLNLSSRPLMISGNYNQLKQVFLNMILNAIDATNGGGDIRISTIRNNDYAQIMFEDKGYGIASENVDKIFEPFFTTKSLGKGTGLGLSICYGIIEDHKGKILVNSNGVGNGTTFTVSLPIRNGK